MTVSSPGGSALRKSARVPKKRVMLDLSDAGDSSKPVASRSNNPSSPGSLSQAVYLSDTDSITTASSIGGDNDTDTDEEMGVPRVTGRRSQAQLGLNDSLTLDSRTPLLSRRGAGAVVAPPSLVAVAPAKRSDAYYYPTSGTGMMDTSPTSALLAVSPNVASPALMMPGAQSNPDSANKSGIVSLSPFAEPKPNTKSPSDLLTQTNNSNEYVLSSGTTHLTSVKNKGGQMGRFLVPQLFHFEAPTVSDANAPQISPANRLSPGPPHRSHLMHSGSSSNLNVGAGLLRSLPASRETSPKFRPLSANPSVVPPTDSLLQASPSPTSLQQQRRLSGSLSTRSRGATGQPSGYFDFVSSRSTNASPLPGNSSYLSVSASLADPSSFLHPSTSTGTNNNQLHAILSVAMGAGQQNKSHMSSAAAGTVPSSTSSNPLLFASPSAMLQSSLSRPVSRSTSPLHHTRTL
jgi:hypothetical protein